MNFAWEDRDGVQGMTNSVVAVFLLKLIQGLQTYEAIPLHAYEPGGPGDASRQSTRNYHLPRKRYPINSEYFKSGKGNRNNSTRTGVLGG